MMDELLRLVKRKNQCFKKIFELGVEFLSHVEKDESQNLEIFRKRRNGLIQIIMSLDNEIQNYCNINKIDKSYLSEKAQEAIGNLNFEKNQMINSINETDKKILQHINRIRSSVINKLQSIQSGRRTIAAYRSPQRRQDELGVSILDKEA